MSERSYFSNRYLIPGAAFLLVVAVLNAVPLYRLLNTYEATTSVFSAILALLGSPVIGFLVSQPWWFYFRQYKFWRIIPTVKLKEKYGLKTDSAPKEVREKILLIYDYILHSDVHSRSEMKGLSNYAFRRYDNYVLLSCSIFAI